MRQKINVIDLDKTLIPFDSFRELIFKEMRSINVSVIYLTFIRLTGIISNNQFKAKMIRSIMKKRGQKYFNDYANYLFNKIDKKVLDIIEKTNGMNVVNVLISASPNIYVEPLINKLGWKGSGSYFDENRNFVHLHGNGKIQYVLNNFPSEYYDYYFSISDSSTDDDLLKLFNIGKKWISQ